MVKSIIRGHGRDGGDDTKTIAATAEFLVARQFLRKMLLVSLMLLVAASFVACGSNNGLPPDISEALVGTWHLTETNLPDAVSDTMELRRDGTGILSLGAMRDNITWLIDDNNDFVVVQFGGAQTIAYTITVLNDSTLSFEADIPGFGLVQLTYVR